MEVNESDMWSLLGDNLHKVGIKNPKISCGIFNRL